jgi:hypothetical protein
MLRPFRTQALAPAGAPHMHAADLDVRAQSLVELDQPPVARGLHEALMERQVPPHVLRGVRVVTGPRQGLESRAETRELVRRDARDERLRREKLERAPDLEDLGDIVRRYAADEGRNVVIRLG